MSLTIYLTALAKQMDKEQTKRKKQKQRKNDEAKGKNKETSCKNKKKRIPRSNRTKTKCGGSCIQSNRFVSLINDIVGSIIILLAITFSNGDPYRSSVHKDFVCSDFAARSVRRTWFDPR